MGGRAALAAPAAAGAEHLDGIRSARAVEMLLPLRLGLYQTIGHADFNLEVRRAR